MPLATSADVNNVMGSTCPPVAQFDQHFAVVEFCPVGDGGVTGEPSVTAFNASSAWSSKVLQTNALATTSFYHFTVDDAGLNALTLGQHKSDAGIITDNLSIVGLSTGTAVTLSANAGAPPATETPGGIPIAYLSGGSEFALFSVFSDGLSKATFATPSAPSPAFQTITDGGTAASAVGGVAAVSPDGKWAITYGTTVSSTLQVPTNLFLQSLTPVSGAFPAPQQISMGADVFLLGFTADASTVLFSADLVSNGFTSGPNDGSIGNLLAAKLEASTTVVQVNQASSIWNATGTHGTAIVYNWNYAMGMFTINGEAYADQGRPMPPRPRWGSSSSRAPTRTTT